MALTKPLTIHERKIMKTYVETGSKAKAAMAHGTYSSVASASIMGGKNLERLNLLSRMEQVFDSVGLTEPFIASKLMEKTDAKKVTYFSHNGLVTDSREDDDHSIQLKALDIAMEVRGMKVTRSASLNLSLNSDDLQGLRSDDLEKMIHECNKELKQLEGVK